MGATASGSLASLGLAISIWILLDLLITGLLPQLLLEVFSVLIVTLSVLGITHLLKLKALMILVSPPAGYVLSVAVRTAIFEGKTGIPFLTSLFNQFTNLLLWELLLVIPLVTLVIYRTNKKRKAVKVQRRPEARTVPAPNVVQSVQRDEVEAQPSKAPKETTPVVEAATTPIVEEPSPQSLVSDVPLSDREMVLIEYIDTRGIREITPVPDRTEILGGRYPMVEEMLNVNSHEATEVIIRLSERGVLTPASVEFKAIKCPKCASSIYNVELLCRNCSSNRLFKTITLQHTTCRTVGPESLFKFNHSYICPTCRVDLTRDIEIHSESVIKSSFFKCEDCGDVFIEPILIFKCLTCGERYGITDAGLKPFYRYTVNRDVLSKYKASIEVQKTLLTALREMGFVVERNAKITGKSGAIYDVDIAVKAGDRYRALIITLRVGGEAAMRRLIKLFILKSDLDIMHLIIVPLVPLDNELYDLAMKQGAVFLNLDQIREPKKETLTSIIGTP
ncbi:MAG: hypothetical protein NZ920_06180 [Aigarchaeota archaeon]|nr:hypothetical protein [Aigarchaeota archaeon]MDW8092694.1 hypothetical protein [Nitrososphaerota archaeon]